MKPALPLVALEAFWREHLGDIEQEWE